MAVSLQNALSQMNQIRAEIAALHAEDELLATEIAKTREQMVQLESETETNVTEYKSLLETATRLKNSLSSDLTLDPLRPEINAAASRIETLRNRVLCLKVSAEVLELRNQNLKMRIITSFANMEEVEKILFALN